MAQTLMLMLFAEMKLLCGASSNFKLSDFAEIVLAEIIPFDLKGKEF